MPAPLAETSAPAVPLAGAQPLLTPPRIGQVWPGQGGIYAGIARGDDADWHLILASTGLGRLAWATSAKAIKGATSARDGLLNTLALVAAKGTHPAAEACRTLEIEGHNDFYLPAQFEAALLYANVREHLSTEWHWTSTQFSAGSAWTQLFYDGTQYDGDKKFAARARACRRLVLQSFGPSDRAA